MRKDIYSTESLLPDISIQTLLLGGLLKKMNCNRVETWQDLEALLMKRLYLLLIIPVTEYWMNRNPEGMLAGMSF